MKNEWDEYAEGWDSDASVQEYANKAYAELADVIDFDGLSVFDFGCGTGSLTQRLSSRVKDIVALDGSPEMIKLLARKNISNVSTIADFLSEELIDSNPYLNNKFDLIVASSVCGFLPDYEMALGLLRSLLKSGGMFVQWDWLADDESSGPGLTEGRVLRALEAQGFAGIQLKKPFVLESSKGTMTVLMAVANNP